MKDEIQNKLETKTYLLIITLNVNGLNSSIKRHMMADWIENQDPPTRDSLQS